MNDKQRKTRTIAIIIVLTIIYFIISIKDNNITFDYIINFKADGYDTRTILLLTIYPLVIIGDIILIYCILKANKNQTNNEKYRNISQRINEITDIKEKEKLLEELRQEMLKIQNENFENVEKENKSGAIAMMILFTIIAIVLMLINYMFDPTNIGKIIFILLGLVLVNLTVYIFAYTKVGIVVHILSGGSNQDADIEEFYSKMYKEIIVSKVLNELFEDVEISYNKGISKETFKKANLISKIFKYDSNNYFKGKYKGIPFEACDITVSHEKLDEYGNTDTILDFRGQYYIFDFNKPIKGNVRIIENPKEDEKKSKDLIMMEDQEFNSTFSVFSDDKHTAYYILTPHFIEKLKELNDEDNYRFSFKDNKVHIAVGNNRTMFDYNPYLKIKSTETIKNIKEDVERINQIVDTLTLDNDLFK